jgi:hypothetical protein
MTLCKTHHAARLAFQAMLLVLSLSSRGMTNFCHQNSNDAVPQERVTYSHKHMITEPTDGHVSVEDTVRVWGRDEKALCFEVTSVTTNLHYCRLSGRAKHIRANVYEYLDETCKTEFEIMAGKLYLRVADPTEKKGSYNICHPGEAFECGGNTAIESGVFLRKM